MLTEQFHVMLLYTLVLRYRYIDTRSQAGVAPQKPSAHATRYTCKDLSLW